MQAAPRDQEPVAELNARQGRLARNGRRLLALTIAVTVLLTAMSPWFVQVYHRAKARTALQRELDAIKQSGEPLTPAELKQYYQTPPGVPDATQVWQKALAPFGENAYEFSTEEVAHVGSVRRTALSKPLPASEESAMRRFLTLHRAKLDAVYDAAQTPGEVRFPQEFATWELVPERSLARTASRALALEFQLLVRDGAIDKVTENLRVRAAVGDTLKQAIDVHALLVRTAIHQHTLHDIHNVTAALLLSDGQLRELQMLAQRLSVEDQLTQAMLGERAEAFFAFCRPGMTVADDKSSVLKYVRDPLGCAETLATYARLRRATQLEAPQALITMDTISKELERKRQGEAPAEPLMDANLSSAVVSGIASTVGRSVAYKRLTLLLLVSRRYQLATGRWPERPDDLVPQYLSEFPADPFDGLPLRMKIEDDVLVLYSVGENRTDEHAQADKVMALHPDLFIKSVIED